MTNPHLITNKNELEKCWQKRKIALHNAAAQLAPVSKSARLDAEVLMAHALGVEREDLLSNLIRYAHHSQNHAQTNTKINTLPDNKQAKHEEHETLSNFTTMIKRRMIHEPVAYITGQRDFWTLKLAVGPGVLIPRSDSEILIIAALHYFARSARSARSDQLATRSAAHEISKAPSRILDLGTGSGALLLAALSEWPNASGIGVDMSQIALDYAQRNARSLGLAARAQWKLGNWNNQLAEKPHKKFTLILCNPPYIKTTAKLMPDVAKYEPKIALYAGSDGLDAYRRIIPELPSLLSKDGLVVLEIDSQQANAVDKIAQVYGFIAERKKDYAGHQRALILTRRNREDLNHINRHT